MREIMKQERKDMIKTAIATLIAIMLTGLAVALILQANLGSDAINVFVEGMTKTLHVSLGTSSRIYNVIVLVIALCLSRKDIGWATILYALGTGFAIDFFMGLVVPYHIGEAAFVVRLLVVCLAQLLFTLAFALLIRYRQGMNQLDAIAYGIEKRCGIGFTVIRTGIDLILLISGYFMGGVVGIGSIITMATTGILINQFVKWLALLP